MTIERKVGMGIAGQPSGGATDVAEVFSTHLYKGTGGNRSVVNGIDLAGEGGMVWMKDRTVDNINAVIADTERGPTKYIYGLAAVTETSLTNSLTSFNSNGFSLGTDDGDWVNKNNRSYVSWTFRKKKKFFDVVTYTGVGNLGGTTSFAHSLGGPVGMIIVKNLSRGNNWPVWHKSINGQQTYINTTAAADSSFSVFSNDSYSTVAPTDTHFTVSGADSEVNRSGDNYVAYLWADNSAEDAEDQMIKCGSYSGNSSTNGPFVNLGWEPQFVLIKAINASESWMMFDSMRGISTGGNDAQLSPNNLSLEYYNERLELNATGFTLKTIDAAFNGTNKNYLYMAIRAPMMIEPTAATDVFATVVGRSSTADGRGNFLSGFPVDFGIAAVAASGGTRFAASRLTGEEYLQTASTAAGANIDSMAFDFSDGWGSTDFGTYNSWMWKRAKGFFDVVGFKGYSNAGTLSHSLGVPPEMVWIKGRNDSSRNWYVYHKDVTLGMRLNTVDYAYFDQNISSPTNTTIHLSASVAVNGSGVTYIGYFWATVDGISKVGSYTGNGSSQTISCGFSAGSRFILIKRTDNDGEWYVWDSVRGIVAGNDPHLSLHTTASQVTNDDSVDPHNSGFIVNQVSATNINVSSATYIFYAIA